MGVLEDGHSLACREGGKVLEARDTELNIVTGQARRMSPITAATSPYHMTQLLLGIPVQSKEHLVPGFAGSRHALCPCTHPSVEPSLS
jgi:hypothetical protein